LKPDSCVFNMHTLAKCQTQYLNIGIHRHQAVECQGSMSVNALPSMPGEGVHSKSATPFHRTVWGQISSDARVKAHTHTHTHTHTQVDNPTPTLMSASVPFKLSSNPCYFFWACSHRCASDAHHSVCGGKRCIGKITKQDVSLYSHN